MFHRLHAAGLSDIADKLEGGARLDLSDGVRLFESDDLLLVGWLANREREKRHGAKAFYNYNIRIEATNVCVASCLFCSFARLKPGDTDAYTMTLDEAWDKLRRRAAQPLTEVHVVNGLHPDLPFSYYTDLLRGFKRIRPNIHLKCFTAVEIAFFSELYKMSGSTRFPGAEPRFSPSACGRRSVMTRPTRTDICRSTGSRTGWA
jgi:aminodeoxyfutalosine synthase